MIIVVIIRLSAIKSERLDFDQWNKTSQFQSIRRKPDSATTL